MILGTIRVFNFCFLWLPLRVFYHTGRYNPAISWLLWRDMYGAKVYLTNQMVLECAAGIVGEMMAKLKEEGCIKE